MSTQTPEQAPRTLAEVRQMRAEENAARQTARLAMLKEVEDPRGFVTTDAAREVSAAVTQEFKIPVDISAAGAAQSIEVHRN